MLNIALCDDSKKALSKYAQWIRTLAQKQQLYIELSCFDSGEALLAQYNEKPNSMDIIYLDILMYATNGMETARKLRAYGCGAQIVFLTSYDDYVFRAFDVSAVQYLIKEETDFSRFEEVFQRAVMQVEKREGERFCFEFDGKTRYIPYADISFFEIWSKRVTIHYERALTAVFYSPMDRVVKMVEGRDFVRAHRSYLVHLPYISCFTSSDIILKTGESVPIGITHAQSIRDEFARYMLRLRTPWLNPAGGALI